MPLWHLRSTITNDLTALGIKEKAQNAAAPGQQAAGPSNLNLDESLKGLGKVVRAKDQVSDDEDVADEDVKPGAAEGTEADCKTTVSPSISIFTAITVKKKRQKQQLISLLLRLRPILRVVGSISRAVHTAHTAIGRVLRIGRFRRRQKAEYRVSRFSERAQQAVEIGGGRRRGRCGTKTGQGRTSRRWLGPRAEAGEWRPPSHEWRGKPGGGRWGCVGRGRPHRLWSVLLFFSPGNIL